MPYNPQDKRLEEEFNKELQEYRKYQESPEYAEERKDRLQRRNRLMDKFSQQPSDYESMVQESDRRNIPELSPEDKQMKIDALQALRNSRDQQIKDDEAFAEFLKIRQKEIEEQNKFSKSENNQKSRQEPSLEDIYNKLEPRSQAAIQSVFNQGQGIETPSEQYDYLQDQLEFGDLDDNEKLYIQRYMQELKKDRDQYRQSRLKEYLSRGR